MLQLGGHHLAYNFTFNGRLPGATPLFFGSEPVSFEMKGVTYAPLDAQSAAMSQSRRRRCDASAGQAFRHFHGCGQRASKSPALPASR